MEPIHWVASYKDGSDLQQYNADGSENSYHHINRNNLDSFALYNGDRPIVRYHFDQPGLRLICRRRVYKTTGAESDLAFYLVGWQKTVGGESLQSISVVGQLPDGSVAVEVISRWQENHFLFDAITPLEFETPCGVSTAQIEGDSA